MTVELAHRDAAAAAALGAAAGGLRDGLAALRADILALLPGPPPPFGAAAVDSEAASFEGAAGEGGYGTTDATTAGMGGNALGGCQREGTAWMPSAGVEAGAAAGRPGAVGLGDEKLVDSEAQVAAEEEDREGAEEDGGGICDEAGVQSRVELMRRGVKRDAAACRPAAAAAAVDGRQSRDWVLPPSPSDIRVCSIGGSEGMAAKLPSAVDSTRLCSLGVRQGWHQPDSGSGQGGGGGCNGVGRGNCDVSGVRKPASVSREGPMLRPDALEVMVAAAASLESPLGASERVPQDHRAGHLAENGCAADCYRDLQRSAALGEAFLKLPQPWNSDSDRLHAQGLEGIEWSRRRSGQRPQSVAEPEQVRLNPKTHVSCPMFVTPVGKLGGGTGRDSAGTAYNDDDGCNGGGDANRAAAVAGSTGTAQQHLGAWGRGEQINNEQRESIIEYQICRLGRLASRFITSAVIFIKSQTKSFS